MLDCYQCLLELGIKVRLMKAGIGLLLDLSGGLVVHHIFLVADLAADSHLLSMDFIVKHCVHIDLVYGLRKTAGQFYQMFSKGDCKDTHPISLVQDIRIPASSELLASATTSPCQDCDPVIIGVVAT